MNKNIEEKLADIAFERDGKLKLKCADAFRFAEENDMNLIEVAGICNRLNIAIVKCQLGCFK